jgi:hypothetical protein
MKSLNTDKIQNWFTAESDSINNDRSSIYTKDDVLKLIDNLKLSLINDATEPETALGINSNHFRDIAECIVREMECDSLDIIDDYDLTMSYKEVELDSVSFNTRKIENIVKQVLDNQLEEIEEEKAANAAVIS